MSDPTVLQVRPASSYVARPRIWRSDIFQTRLETIEPGRIESATFSYNDDFDTKRQATIRLRDPDTLQSLADWIIAEVDISDDVGNRFTVPLGHYVAIEPDIDHTGTGRKATVEMRDLSWILRQATIAEIMTIPAGVDHGAAARQLALDFGVPAPLVNIADSGTLTPSDVQPEETDNVLSFMTKLLGGGGMYQPWIAADHRLTSIKARDISNAPADYEINNASGTKILPKITNRPQISSLRNQITVRRAVPGEPIIEATATVEDMGSPAHPLNIGRLMGSPNTPIILGRIDPESTIASEADARALAEARLSVAASYLDRLNISTYPDPYTLDGHKILTVDVTHGNASYYTGNWLQRTWSVTVGRGAPIVERELTRTVNWR